MGLVVVVTEGQGSWGCCSPGRGHQEVEVSMGHGRGHPNLALVTALL